MSDINYQVIGEGPPIVLLHGISGSSEDWVDAGYVKDLRESNQLILTDFRGLGESKKYHDPGSYSLDIFSKDIISIIDRLEINNFGLLGFSMGGVIAYWTTLMYADRINSLIMLDGIITPDLVEIYENYGTSAEQIINQYLAEPRMTDSKKSRLLKNDIDAVQAIGQGLARSISKNLEEFMSLPEFNIPYFVLTSDLSESQLDLSDYLTWAKSAPESKSYADFIHADFIFRSDIVIPEIKEFLQAI